MADYSRGNRRRFSFGDDGNAVVALITTLIIAFLILYFIQVIYLFTYPKEEAAQHFRNYIFNWVTLPAGFSAFLERPWTLITHCIVQNGVLNLLSNLLWLWAFGYIMQDLAGNKQIIPVFIYGAIAGAIAFLLVYNLIPSLRTAAATVSNFGPSAGIMAIALAVTVMAPGYRMFPMIRGGIPVWILTVIFVVIDLISIDPAKPGLYAAHLAGAAIGFFFMHELQRGRNWGAWMENLYDWFNNLFNPDKPAKNKSFKTQLFYKAGVVPYQKKTNLSQQKIDEILEKIHRQGYDSLTEEEKNILKQAGE